MAKWLPFSENKLPKKNVNDNNKNFETHSETRPTLVPNGSVKNVTFIQTLAPYEHPYSGYTHHVSSILGGGRGRGGENRTNEYLISYGRWIDKPISEKKKKLITKQRTCETN